jgi:hypothetical protein
MKKLALIFCLFSWLPLMGSHIVGGEFELLHVSGYIYQLNLIYYFDENNGAQANKTQDQIIHVKIFRSVDGLFITSIDLPFVSQTPVPYTQPSCSHGEIATSKQYYSTQIILSPTTYNDPAGYYVVWERCCRNYFIDNIISENANGFPNNPNSAGQTFYLKFPPVIKNGEQFVNSSPHLFPPLNDFACPYRSYYVDFAGVDDDGDSLIYSVTTPWDTQDHNPYPAINPGPYPDIKWMPGYGISNIIGGNPDLQISTDGLLTVTPTKQGLFVFAIKVQEFRKGVKIGETRRDFQMLVADQCAHDDPPSITGKKLNDTDFTYAKNMSIEFADTVSNATRCIQVRVTDPQSLDPADNFTENIHIKAIALNFKSKTISQILPAQVSGVLSNGSDKIFTICFPECPFIDGPYQVGIVAFDDACSLPMTDTLRITVNVQPPPNSNAYFVPPKTSTIQLNEGQSASWPFTAKDDDGDEIVLSVIPDNFALNNAGMTYHSNLVPGLAAGSIDWNAFCKIYNFTKKTEFIVRVLADDMDKCNIIHYDTALVNFKVILPASHPVLTIYNADKTKDLTNSSIETNLGHMTLDLVGVDNDAFPTDTLKLSLLSANGSVAPDRYTFNAVKGFTSIESVFTWDTDCSIFHEGNYDNHYTFRFLFTNNHCLTPTADTAYVNARIKDIESSDQNFIPANVITANGDNCNDFFAIDGFDGAPDCNGSTRVIPFTAPLDNCVNRFEQVRIYNRWGKQVFESTDRKFRWYALSESPGVYYYFIKYTRAEYKSSITVIH